MRDKNIFTLNENFLWLTIMIYTLLSCYIDSKYNVVFFFWSLILIIYGNLKRLRSKKYDNLFTLIRRVGYLLPLFLPLVLPTFRVEISFEILWIFVAIIIGSLFLLPKLNEYKLMLSDEFIDMRGKITINQGVSAIIVLLGSAVGEEMFFRNFIIGYPQHEYVTISIFISSITFFMNHFGLKWGEKFSLYDCSIQVVFGIVSSLMFIVSGNLLPCIVMHIVYNLPQIVMAIKRMRLVETKTY